MAGSNSIAQVACTRTLLVGAGRDSLLEPAGTRTPAGGLDSKLLVAAELGTELACNRLRPKALSVRNSRTNPIEKSRVNDSE